MGKTKFLVMELKPLFKHSPREQNGRLADNVSKGLQFYCTSFIKAYDNNPRLKRPNFSLKQIKHISTFTLPSAAKLPYKGSEGNETPSSHGRDQTLG